MYFNHPPPPPSQLSSVSPTTSFPPTLILEFVYSVGALSPPTGLGRLMAWAPRGPFLLKSNGCFLESMTVADEEFPTRGGSMECRRGKVRWAGVCAVCQDLYRPLQPCDSNVFTVLAELRKCGLTDSETCLKSVTLSLGGGQTVSIMEGAEGSSGRGRSWGGVGGICSHRRSPGYTSRAESASTICGPSSGTLQ